jgi:cytochrome oxidase Cu insertion factor (SCO1/SenC/PrrC family)
LLSNSGSSHHLTNSRQAPFSRLAKSHNIELKSNHRLDSGTDHSSSRIMVTKTYRVNGTREDSESMEDILDQRMPTHYRP